MAGDVHERQVLGADELDRRTFEETIVLLAHETCILNRLVRHGTNIGICADDAHVILGLRTIRASRGGSRSNVTI